MVVCNCHFVRHVDVWKSAPLPLSPLTFIRTLRLLVFDTALLLVVRLPSVAATCRCPASRYKMLSSVPGNTHLSQLLLRINFNQFFSSSVRDL